MFVSLYYYFHPCSHIMTIFWCFCSWEVSTLGILLGDRTLNNTPWRLGTPQCWELHRKLILLHIGHIHQAPLIMEGSIVLCIARLHWVVNRRLGSRSFNCTSLGLLCYFASHLIWQWVSLPKFTIGYGEVGFLIWKNWQSSWYLFKPSVHVLVEI